jgi:hypothetical protein
MNIRHHQVPTDKRHELVSWLYKLVDYFVRIKRIVSKFAYDARRIVYTILLDDL